VQNQPTEEDYQPPYEEQKVALAQDGAAFEQVVPEATDTVVVDREERKSVSVPTNANRQEVLDEISRKTYKPES